MDYESAKVAIRASKTQAGVYGALERAGIDTGTYNLEKRRKIARDAFHHDEADVIQCAIMRLRQIDYREA